MSAVIAFPAGVLPWSGYRDDEERFRRTISALPEGIVLVDLSLQIDWCNPVAEQHLCLSLAGDHGLRRRSSIV